MPTIRRFLLGTALVLAAISGQLLIRAGHPFAGGSALLYSAVLFAVVFQGAPITVATIDTGMARSMSRSDWLALGSVVVSGCLAVSGLVLLDVREPSAIFWLIYSLSLVAALLPAAGLVLAEGVRNAGTGSRSTWLWLLVILAVASMVRLAGLSSLPFGTWYDEAANGLEALRIINEPQYRPVYTDGVNASGHYLYLIVASFSLFGVDTQSIRLVSALAGIATVAAAYLAGRELFGHRMGLALAFVVGVSRWAINFSRLGMYNTLTPLFELLTIAFLARALRRNSLPDYVLAGVSLGLGFCYYAAFQLFAVALAVFLAYVVVLRWRPVKQFWLGLAVMALSALVVVAPIIAYAIERPDSYFARVQNTSLFSDKLPEERVPALAENLRKHVLMFNVRGDPNGRHNLPGEPMLDPVVAALFAIGVVLCLARWRQPIGMLLLLWFGMALMGGVLSLDFEAPQSLRSIAALPAVYILAVIPLYVLNREWAAGGGRYYPNAAAGMIVLILLPSAFYNLDTYFRRQAQDFASWNAFSTPETLAAQHLNALDGDASAYVISLYDNHPTVRFLAQDAAPYRRLETTASMPIVDSTEGEIVLILDAERRDLYDEVLHLYPDATHEAVRPPFGGPAVLYYVEIPQSERERLQGFTATYSSAENPEIVVTRKDAQIDFDWPGEAPLELPFTVEWTGVLAAETYGPHQFGLVAPGPASVFLNETPLVVLEKGGEASEGVVLPRGRHQLRVVAEGGVGAVRLLWRSPDRPTEVVPQWAVFREPVTNNGLLGRYYAIGDWSGPPVLEQIDHDFDKYFHIPVLPRPYTVEWVGKIAIPESGRYGFGLASRDDSAIFIGEAEIVRSAGDGGYGEGYADLESGLHDIRIRYADRSDHTFLTAYWIPPHTLGSRLRLPDDILFPPQGSYERVALPSLTELNRAQGDVTGRDSDLVSETVMADVVATGLRGALGIAALPDGVAVALPEEGRVVVLDESGRMLQDTSPAGAQLQEPFDLDADERGTLYVLDAGAGTVSEFGRDLAYVGTLPIDPSVLQRARGIGLDGNGGLWIADTPGGQLVRFDLESGALRSLPVNQHLSGFGEAQPVDVAAAADGSLYTTDAGVHRLSRYIDDNMRIWSAEIPIANTIHGAHLAAGPGGSVYMTEPENGSLVQVDEAGTVLKRWRLRTGDGGAVKPVGIAVDANGAIWVTDVEGGRVLRFMPVGGQ